jgi:hypothetical protein
MEFQKEGEEGFGRVQEKDYIPYLELDFGNEKVVIIKISIINVYPCIL